MAPVPSSFVNRCEENFPGWDIDTEAFVFLKAVERYQRANNRRYPTWREVLAVAHSLGYRRVAAADSPEFESLFTAVAVAPAAPPEDAR